MCKISQQNILLFHAARSIKSKLLKSLAFSGLVLYIIYLMSNHPRFNSSSLFAKLRNNNNQAQNPSTPSPSNISHIVFGIASSSNTWKYRRSYVEAWWQPNVTRGFLFLDKIRTEFFPWPPSSPPFRISENTSRYKKYDKHRTKQAIRMVRMIVEMFKAENRGVRWYVLMDDDTIIFINNLVDVLRKYDHCKYFYIGANSESIASNSLHSFEMGFGGAGYALSYPLAEALVKNMDVCIKRYPTLYGSDHMVQSCVADLGVSLTQEKGFHQIDLHRDISGFLSAHPHSPLLSLHHLDAVDPLFPSMDHNASFNHLIKAAKTDQSRLFQQTICSFKPENWTLSLSWGYSAQIYHGFNPPSFLLRPLETFLPWSRFARPPYMFNTRFPTKNHPNCEAPYYFFFDSVEETTGNYAVTIYNRTYPGKLSGCSSNHSTSTILSIRVLSPFSGYKVVRTRRECCDIVREAGMDDVEVKLRTCLKDEFLA